MTWRTGFPTRGCWRILRCGIVRTFQDTWEKGTNDLREEIKAASSAVSGALGAYSEYMEKAKEYMAAVQTAAEALGQSPVVGSGA